MTYYHEVFFNIVTQNYPTHSYTIRQCKILRPDSPKTFLAKSTIRYAIPELINELPPCIINKVTTHSIQGLSNYSKKYFLNLYEDKYQIQDCYICELHDPNPE